MVRSSTHSGSPYEDRYGFARGVRIGNRVEISGTAPIPPSGEPVARSAFDQMLRCGEIAVAALGDLGAATSDVVRTRMFLTNVDDADEVGRAHREIFGAANPAATMVVLAALLDPAWKVELEVQAVLEG